jgi:hypothetical protein
VVRDGADPRDVAIVNDGPIIVGKFVDIDRPTFADRCKLVVDKAHKKGK